MVPILEQQSNTCFRDEGYNKVCATLFIIAETSDEAKKKSKEAFVKWIEDHDMDVVELDGMGDAEKKEAYEDDATLYSIYEGWKGNVTVRECNDGISEGVFV